jgi:hypothetical protein
MVSQSRVHDKAASRQVAVRDAAYIIRRARRYAAAAGTAAFPLGK